MEGTRKAAVTLALAVALCFGMVSSAQATGRK